MSSLLPCLRSALRQTAKAGPCRIRDASSVARSAVVQINRSSPLIYAGPSGLSRTSRPEFAEPSLGSLHCRCFSASRARRKEEWPKVSVARQETGLPPVDQPGIVQSDPTADAPAADSQVSSASTVSSRPTIPDEPTVKHVRDEDLPSRRAALRSQLTKWFNTKMEETIPKLLLASQRINSFTGTDYSAIEELRREIKEQEQLVRARHAAVTKAKEALEQAHVQRGASQKEVVGLLERKHSWSAGDLERYMNLIRSEHQNDHAVQEAKDLVNTTEKALEESRARLETRERRQYHEEQIWSDTIRRNSTWITFGLMGVNFLLLLMNLVVFEPYRRRKIVREIKAALDEKSISSSLTTSGPESVVAAQVPPSIETSAPDVNNAPVSTITEMLAGPSTSTTPVDDTIQATPVVSVEPEVPPTAETSGRDQPVIMTESASRPVEAPSPAIDTESAPTEQQEHAPRPAEDFWTVEHLKAYAADLVSERPTTLRMLDVTTIAIESAVAGAAFVALLIVMLRPNP